MRHLDEGTIHAWLDGALSAETERKAEEHAARCTECAVAVADARGLIAATSRILTALDDVPAGVIPRGEVMARAPRDGGSEPRRWPVWQIRIAASILIVVTGVVLLRKTEVAPREVALKPEVPVSASASASAGTRGTATAGTAAETLNTAMLDQRKPEEKAKVAFSTADSQSMRQVYGRARVEAGQDSGALSSVAVAGANEPQALMAQAPAAPPVAASSTLVANDKLAEKSSPAAKAQELDSGSAARNLAGSVATVSPKIEVASQGGASGATAAKRAANIEQMGLPPGWRLVSEQRTASTARVVERRVYEVKPGVQVTYAIFAPPVTTASPAPSAAPADAAGASDSDEKEDAAEEGSGVNSIRWSDTKGRSYRLSGRIPLDSLRALQPLLPPPGPPK